MASVYIPVQNSEEEVRVALDQLPKDAADILDILKAEQAPLDLWLIIAREYFKQGKLEQFRQILEEGSSHEIDDYYADVRYERIAILNALGAYYSYLGKIETRTREKEEYFIQATKHYNKASRIDMHEPSTWVGKGQLLLVKGELEQASAAFRIVLEGDRDNVSALLGQACVEYNRGRFNDSLALYKRALLVHPCCPGAVRLGIGHCHYKLGNLGKARLAFQRVLQLDPENVEALVALAILDLQANDAAGIRKGMEKMQMAFETYPYCAMALNYLANHFFFTGQHFLVEQLTETALAVTTHGPTKSQSYYNLARSYHSKNFRVAYDTCLVLSQSGLGRTVNMHDNVAKLLQGDYETASRYYRFSVQEINKPQDFIFPYYGLGQVQLKLGDVKNALSNFEKVLEVNPDNCETLKVLGFIHVQLGQNDKAQEFLRKATKADPRDPQAFLDLGELLISSDSGAALDAFTTARGLLKRCGQEVPLDVLNNIGVIHFERDELELALQAFKEALGDGIWLVLLDGKAKTSSSEELQCKDMKFFHKLEDDGQNVEVPWNKVTVLFNLARLLEQLHQTETATMLYHLILYKYPSYEDAYLRLAAIAKARNNLQRSIELVNETLKVNDKCPNALSMLGELELKNDDWVKAKETLRAANEVTGGKDSYSTLSLGNWNYFAAMRNEKRNPKLEATHLEKAKELYSKVLVQHTDNMYAANGAAIVLAEKGQFNVSKDLFARVQEVGSGKTFVPMPDVWINLAHVYFAQGDFASAVKMYQNCLRKFYYNTDSQILLYMARTHYEAEKWQDCKKSLMRAIHLAPSNYVLRFDAGVAMQKSSASTLLKEKRTASELRSTIDELENAVRLFGQLSAASNLNVHGFDEKKINTHVEYCKHLLEAAKLHYEAAAELEQQTRQRQEVARREAEALEARRIAEEQWKIQMERRKQEDMLKQVMQQEQHLERLKEQWKTSGLASKRKDRSEVDGEDGGRSEKRRRKGGKRRKKDKGSKPQYDIEEGEADVIDDHEEQEYEDPEMSYRPQNEISNDDANAEDDAQDLLAAAGLEDSDAEDENAAPSTGRRKQAWSESDEDEQLEGEPISRPVENSPEVHDSDGELKDIDNLREEAAPDDD